MGKKGKNKNPTVINVNEGSPKLEDKAEVKKETPAALPVAPSVSLPPATPIIEPVVSKIVESPEADADNDGAFEEGTLKSKKKRNRKKKSIS